MTLIPTLIFAAKAVLSRENQPNQRHQRATLSVLPNVVSCSGIIILPKNRDPRFITLRRDGTLQDADHHLLALWAADCAARVLPLFAAVWPHDDRPRHAIELARAWTRGEVTMTQARAAAGHANAAAQAAVAHVAAHQLGAAAYAIKAARAAAPEGDSEAAGRRECRWQRERLPEPIRELVLDDQQLRNDICWWVFDC